jgi:hypothetical protein
VTCRVTQVEHVRTSLSTSYHHASLHTHLEAPCCTSCCACLGLLGRSVPSPASYPGASNSSLGCAAGAFVTAIRLRCAVGARELLVEPAWMGGGRRRSLDNERA